MFENLECVMGDVCRSVGKYELVFKGLKVVVGIFSSSFIGFGRIVIRLFIGCVLVDGIKRVGGVLVDIVNNGVDVSKELVDI